VGFTLLRKAHHFHDVNKREGVEKRQGRNAERGIQTEKEAKQSRTEQSSQRAPLKKTGPGGERRQAYLDNHGGGTHSWSTPRQLSALLNRRKGVSWEDIPKLWACVGHKVPDQELKHGDPEQDIR